MEGKVLGNATGKKAHFLWIDVLRTLAIFAVLVQHAATYYLEGQYTTGMVSGIYVLSSLTKFHVPVFVMITGALLLGKTISIKDAWLKYIKRIAIAFAAWSLLYTVYNTVLRIGNTGIVDLVKIAVLDFVSGGTGRMWYLVMLAGLYMMTPIFSKFFRESTDKEQEYVLFILLLVVSVLPTLTMIPVLNTAFGLDVARLSMSFPGIYVFYFLAGGYFAASDRKWLSKRKAWTILCLSVIALVVFSVCKQQISDLIILPVVTLAVSVFSLVKNINIGERAARVIKSTGECTFGIYLVHTLFQYVMQLIGLEKVLFSMPAIIGILLYSIVLFMISWGVIALLRLTKWGRVIT